MGAKGILLKSYCPFMYEYADILDAMFAGHNMFNVFSACGKSLYHKCMGNVWSTLTMIA